MIEAKTGTPVAFKTQSSAEVYDPRFGTFTATGNMITPRSGHTATLLPNGKVLIAGGGVTNAAKGAFGDPTFASAELYDPSTGTFSATGEMTTAHFGNTATLLNNGKVLIAGGFQRDPGSLTVRLLARAELYDPSSGTFTPTGDMISEWADTATLLANGKVLITTGNPDGPPPFVSAAELYDPSIGMFTSAGYMTVNHTGPTATALVNGKVLIAGGDMGDGDGPTGVAELFDPATATFAATGGMTLGREQDSATLLPDGSVLFAGGHNSNLAASAEIYDPVQQAFNTTSGMSTLRELQTATLLNDGRVLIAGGDDERYWIPETILSSAEIYTPSVLVPAPELLSLSGDGQGQGAIQHAGTTRLASAEDPAVAGESLAIYLMGLADGSAIPPQVAIGGRLAGITYFGNVSGYPGLNVVNVRMPSGVAPGPAVPVRLTYLGRFSNQVTIGVTELALQQAVIAIKTAAGTDSLDFWQWAWYWQNSPPFSGAPAGFGVGGSISPDVMEQIVTAGGGDPHRNVSAEQWVLYFRQVLPQQ